MTMNTLDKDIKLGMEDAALILRSDGGMDLSLPDLEHEYVPENVLMTAAVAHALGDDVLYEKIRDAFLVSSYNHDLPAAGNDNI